MARAFIAIRPPESVCDAVEARVASVSLGGGRPAPRDQWHLTVQFLGNDTDLAAVTSVFAAEPLDVGVGELRLGGARTFGNPRRARIVALGLREGGEWTKALARQVARRLAPLGHVRDAREPAFVPHLTLARFREPADLRSICAAIGPEPVGRGWRVDEIGLFSSELHPHGARHVLSASLATHRAPRDRPR